MHPNAATSSSPRGANSVAVDVAAPQPRAFVWLMAAQFVSALADNAVLIVAIAMLEQRGSPPWLAPVLKLLFIVSYVVFAFAVGRIADAYPKARVMLVTNAIKLAGCMLLMSGTHPLLAYAVIGVGAAAYSPAKYGLMVELLPAQQLVRGNAWLEGLTIASVILGTLFGGFLVSPEFARLALAAGGGSSTHLLAATGVVLGLYALAAAINLRLPNTTPVLLKKSQMRQHMLTNFWHAVLRLVRDPLGRISLATTTLLWGIGAAMQFVALDWGRENLGLSLDRASILQGVVALGVAVGAVVAARHITLAAAPRILPVGLIIGPLLLLMLPVQTVWTACLMLTLVGAVAGFFVVPMNALLQHRGYALVNSGQSIAVQNFSENLSVIVLLGAYAVLRAGEVPLEWIVVFFASLVFALMLLIVIWHRSHGKTSKESP